MPKFKLVEQEPEINRRRAEALATKKRISESASYLFSKYGFASVRITDIISDCGLTKGAFYHYFSSKEDCLTYLHLNYVEYAFERFSEITSKEEPADVVIRKMMTEMFYQIRDFRAEVVVLLETGRIIAPDIVLKIENRKTEIRHLFESAIKRGQAEGTFSATHDPHSAALAVYGMCIWAYNWFDPSRSKSAEEIGKDFSDIVLGGLGSHSRLFEVPKLDNTDHE